jgi:hypothetical protein
MAGRTLLALRAAAIPILIAIITYLESHQPFALFRLAALGAIFLLFADAASLLRGKWRDFLTVLSSLAFGICLIEAIATSREPKELMTVSPDGLYAPRPVIGWGPDRPGQFRAEKTDPKTGAAIYSANYTIDSNLLRKTLSCESGPTVVFFGCSFTFGEGLNDADTFPQAFADSANHKVRVLNLGFSGYGPQHFLAELQSGIFDSVIGLQPRLFVMLTSAGHAERSACKPYFVRNGPRYAIKEGQLVLKGACYEGFRLWLREWLQKSAAYRWLIEPYRRRLSHDDVELYVQIVLAAVNVAKAKYGVPVIVLYLTSGDATSDGDSYLRETGFTTQDIIQRLRDGGAIVVNAMPDEKAAAGMALTISGDGHPTGLANRIQAAILKNYLDQNMPGVLASTFN